MDGNGNGNDLKFAGFDDKAFLFFKDSVQDEVDTDSFIYKESISCVVRCDDNKYLYLKDTNQFDREHLTISQLQSDSADYQLKLAYYRDSTLESRFGRAVMLYAVNNKNNKMYAAACINEEKVVAKEIQDVEKIIKNDQHEAVFYMVREEDSNNMCKLQSSQFPEKALGFDEATSSKLILRRYPDNDNQYDRVEIVTVRS